MLTPSQTVSCNTVALGPSGRLVSRFPVTLSYDSGPRGLKVVEICWRFAPPDFVPLTLINELCAGQAAEAKLHLGEHILELDPAALREFLDRVKDL